MTARSPGRSDGGRPLPERALDAGRDRAALVVLAVVVYLPLLLTAPGRVGADTKSYLYLDPARLLSRAWSMWDPLVGFGTVTHQTIGYLWPMGPWFWLSERIGLPDWVAQRLWLGTILFTAGAGTWWLLRRVLGWSALAAGVAAFAYALTPYTLALAARISALLLPFAGLPWLIGLTVLAVRRGGWRHPALFALVVATIGSVNATALVLAGLGPVLWLLHVRFVRREATTGEVVAVAARIGALTAAASSWWVSGLWAQSGWGIDILRYTETAQTVASSSVATEVLRGLGYWFFYGGDRLGPWIEPGSAYTQRLLLLALTFALPVLALLATARTRFAHRAYFVALGTLGTVAAVGAHPWDGGSVVSGVIRTLVDTDAGLALRSLPRAVPLLALALAAGLGAGVESLRGAARPALARLARPAAAVAVIASVGALPPLWTGQLVADNLDRPSALPAYWLDAAAHLQSGADGSAGTRVLELPGIDFASYRWGNTVDPITPGLTDRPYVARELIPYGSPPSADLLNAIDRNLQEGTLEPAAVAPLLRLAGIGEVVHRGDTQYERYRTARPEAVADLLDAAPGLGAPEGFGEPTVNDAIPELPLIDEQTLRDGPREARPPVQVYPVDDAAPLAHAVPADAAVVVAGDGEGLVSAAAAGLLSGEELVRYAASLTPDELAAAVDGAAGVVVTDTARRQGERWSTLAANLGYVEAAGEEPLERDPTDNRLPVFGEGEGAAGADEGDGTVAERPGGVEARATSYGNAISLTPEYAPGQAVDGDLRTEWRVAAERPVDGERLVLRFDPAVSADEVTLVQRQRGPIGRVLTEVDVRVDGGPPQRVTLDEASTAADGQVVALDGGEQEITELTVELVADSSGLEAEPGRPVRYTGQAAVGFAEVQVGDRVADERWRLPAAPLAAADGHPLAVVLERWRTDPSEALRDDPELALARAFELPAAREFTVSGTARLSARAQDPLLDEILGAEGARVVASTRLPGDAAARASAALDGDPTTAWTPAFYDAAPTLTVEVNEPVTTDTIGLRWLDDGVRSTPATLTVVADGGEPIDVPVPATAAVDGVATAEVALDTAVTGSTFELTFTMAERLVTDWYSGSPVPVPLGIAEVEVPGVAVDLAGGDDPVDTGCRADLLRVDGAPVAVRATGSAADAVARRPLAVEACDGPLDLGPGTHGVEAEPGLDTGLDLDRLVLRSDADGAAATADGPVAATPGDTPTVEVLDEGRASMRLRVSGATPGEAMWLVLGQSWNEGWEASGGVEGPSELVDGYANGWPVVPDADTFDVELTWAPQRVVTASLAVSGLAVLACIALAVRRPPHPATVAVAAVEGVGPAQRRFTGTAPAPVPTAVAAVALGLGAALVIGPVVGVVTALATVAGCRFAGARRALVLAPAACLAAAAAFVLVRQARVRPTPALEWPAELAATHQVSYAAIALLVVIIACDRLWRRR